MAELSYMPFFPADWLLDTEGLSPDAYRCYHILLCKMWLNRSNALPADRSTLRSRCGIENGNRWSRIWAEIEHYFVVDAEGLLRSEKLDRVRSATRSKMAARQAAGRKGAASKWRKTKEPGDGKAYGKSNGKKHGNQNQTDINISARARARGVQSDLEGGQAEAAQQVADRIKSGKRFLCTSISAATGYELIEAGLVTEEDCRAVGVI